MNLPYHDRIEDLTFRRAVELLDEGQAEELRKFLAQFPRLVSQRIYFGGDGYFSNPGLLEFVAENPVRHGRLPANILDVTQAILDAGAKGDARAVNKTLGLVASGRIARECRLQVPLIRLLCEYGAEPNRAMPASLVHGEFEAARALIQCGASVDLMVAAALGLSRELREFLPTADEELRHRALALAAQFGHVALVEALLNAGVDPNRYNPTGFHGHSTPLHQAALAGHEAVVKLLIEHGANLAIKDKLWEGTAADWARHGNHLAIEMRLREQE